MSKALYRKYRSKSLDEIVGQQHITAILQRAIEKDKIAHAYLLTGPKGVGKTSIARILAHEINKLPYTDESQHLDIIEIDAASNNSVEDVRDLREKVQIAPISAKRKVYIIDEVHMLSKQAFNALLKTLEEPPEHIVFILATTDAEKLPATIISRVQRFNFRAISQQDAVQHLKEIAKKENVDGNDAALQLIAAHGKGSFRDSIGLLDQVQHVSDGAITYDMVAQLLGLADQELIADLLKAHTEGDLPKSVTLLNNASASGTPAHVIAEQLIATIRQNITKQPHLLPLLDDLLDVPKSAWPDVKLLTALTRNVEKLASTNKKQANASKSEQANSPTPSRTTKESTDKSDNNTKDSTIKNNHNEPFVVPFDWTAFTDAVKPKAPGAFAILKNCSYNYDGKTVTIYSGKKFNKNKLDAALAGLNAALASLNVQAEIIITDTAKPPADKTTAAILDMMGGGEELAPGA